MLLLLLSTSLISCSYQAETSSEQSISQESEPNAEQIKADLIGHQLLSYGWTFAALSEYEQFEIIGEQKQGNVIEYDVTMELVDLPTDEHFLLDALIVYRMSDGDWELISILPKYFEHVGDGTTF